MVRSLGVFAACALIGVLASSGPAAIAQDDPEFQYEISKIPDDIKERMKGSSWHEGCPVPIKHLRLLRLTYWGFDKEVHDGKLIVNRDSDETMVQVFEKLFKKRFPIKRMKLVDAYGGDDNASMNKNNTSAFNCRNVAGTDHWSQHAYGHAIDINPVQNPYVRSDGTASPEKGQPYTDRSNHRRGMIHAEGGVVKAFATIGWGWGGYWSSAKDYQHFSSTGS